MKLTITPNDRGGYTPVDEHGNVLPLTELTINRFGRVTAEVAVHEVSLIDAEVSSWVGLDRVPTEALFTELGRRGHVLQPGERVLTREQLDRETDRG